MDENSFQKILDQLPNLIIVKLQGMGEPLLNRQLISMLKLGEKRGISMGFYSNGTVYDETIAKHLLELKDTYIYFSIDGATAEVFEKIRVGSEFERILLILRILFNFVATKNNHRSPFGL